MQQTSGIVSLLSSMFGSLDTSGSHILFPLETSLVVNVTPSVSFLP